MSAFSILFKNLHPHSSLLPPASSPQEADPILTPLVIRKHTFPHRNTSVSLFKSNVFTTSWVRLWLVDLCWESNLVTDFCSLLSSTNYWNTRTHIHTQQTLNIAHILYIRGYWPYVWIIVWIFVCLFLPFGPALSWRPIQDVPPPLAWRQLGKAPAPPPPSSEECSMSGGRENYLGKYSKKNWSFELFQFPYQIKITFFLC